MSNVEKILTEIKNKHIVPWPRWRIFLRHTAIWLLVAIAASLSSIAFSAAIFIVANQDWDLPQRLNINPSAFYLAILPYFWLLILVIFAIAAYFNFRHTKRGYKLPLLVVLITYIISTAGVSTALYRLGLGSKIEQMASNTVPYYNQMIYARSVWSRHDDGLLAGKILSAITNQIKIMDLDGEVWTVDIASSSGKNIIWEEKDIKIIGQKIDTGQFVATEIRPWCGCSGCQKHQGQSCLDHCRINAQ